jgi:RNA polymerase sigma factor (sigma-70 family)
MDDLIIRLKQNDAAAFSEVYHSSYKICASFIIKNGGNETVAKDIFHEVMIIFVNKIRQPDFILKNKVSTYLYGICRNLWFQEWKDKNHSKTEYIIDEYGVDLFDKVEEKNDEEVYDMLLLKHCMNILKKFGKEDCQKIITSFYFDNLSLTEIAEQNGYTKAYAKRKKYNCMGYLKKEILSSLSRIESKY